MYIYYIIYTAAARGIFFISTVCAQNVFLWALQYPRFYENKTRLNIYTYVCILLCTEFSLFLINLPSYDDVKIPFYLLTTRTTLLIESTKLRTVKMKSYFLINISTKNIQNYYEIIFTVGTKFAVMVLVLSYTIS